MARQVTSEFDRLDALVREKEMQNDSVKKGAFESEIQKKIEEIALDYDLDDMNSNDKITIRELAQAMLSLDYYEYLTYLQRDGDKRDLESLEKIKSNLRTDISRQQDDLKITRKVRQSSKESSGLALVESLKAKAKEFYKSRMSYVYCPKCNMLLGTVWALYSEDKTNKITLKCNRKNGDGDICGEVVTLDLKTLIANRGTNNKENTPESFV